MRCVSEDVYRRLNADLIRKNNITCEGFPQLPFQFAYDSLLDRMCRSHERDSELRAMLRGCSHYSFTRKDLEEREQAREEQIEELNSQIEGLSGSILSDLRREVDAMSPYEVLMNAPQPWSEFSPEEWLDMHRLRPQEHRLAAVRVRIAELRALNWNTELSNWKSRIRNWIQGRLWNTESRTLRSEGQRGGCGACQKTSSDRSVLKRSKKVM